MIRYDKKHILCHFLIIWFVHFSPSVKSWAVGMWEYGPFHTCGVCNSMALIKLLFKLCNFVLYMKRGKVFFSFNDPHNFQPKYNILQNQTKWLQLLIFWSTIHLLHISNEASLRFNCIEIQKLSSKYANTVGCFRNTNISIHILSDL